MHETHLILENYSTFISENSALFTESTSAVSVITDALTYESYKDKLLEGIEESTARIIGAQFDRQREVLLEESSNLLSSPEAISYAVASFPMLVDIYADPLLSKVISVYPSSVPVMTIPRLKWIAKVIDIKGNAKDYEFPNAQALIRVDKITTVIPGSNGDIFKINDIASSEFRLNKRNFKIVSVKLGTGVVGEPDITVPAIAYADSRGNFSAEFEVVANDPKTLVRVQGQITFDTGAVFVSLANIGADAAYVLKETTTDCRIQGVGNGKAVVKARPKMEGLDINCDIEDAFEVENIEEVIQDWKSLYNLDIIAQLKSYVKDQIKLNRDFEIAELLDANYRMGNGVCKKVNLDTLIAADKIRVSNSMEIFKSIIPVIVSMIEQLSQGTRMMPKYLVTGIDTAAMIKSLQKFSVSFEGNEGTTAFSGEIGSFSKLEVITSFAVGNSMIYLIPKSETLSQSTIVEISHKPLYIITETTNSIRRTFIKCRNWIGIVRGEAIGSLEILGIQKYLGY